MKKLTELCDLAKHVTLDFLVPFSINFLSLYRVNLAVVMA